MNGQARWLERRPGPVKSQNRTASLVLNATRHTPLFILARAQRLQRVLLGMEIVTLVWSQPKIIPVQSPDIALKLGYQGSFRCGLHNLSVCPVCPS